MVRALAGNAAGIPVKFENSEPGISRRIDLDKVESDLKQYLDLFESDPPQRFRNFQGWKARPENLDDNNLAIVAWLQDEQSREVYQAVYTDI